MTKETVNKILISLAALFTVFGLLNLSGAANYLVSVLDSVWAAGLTIIGLITGLIGFFKPEPPVTLRIDGTKVKSILNQVLVGLGTLASFLGLSKLTEIVNFLLVNLDPTYSAVMTLVGAFIAVVAYFKN